MNAKPEGVFFTLSGFAIIVYQDDRFYRERIYMPLAAALSFHNLFKLQNNALGEISESVVVFLFSTTD